MYSSILFTLNCPQYLAQSAIIPAVAAATADNTKAAAITAMSAYQTIWRTERNNKKNDAAIVSFCEVKYKLLSLDLLILAILFCYNRFQSAPFLI